MAHGEDPHTGGPVAAFSVARHGYDRTEVNRYFQQLEAQARHVAAERDYFQQQSAELAGQLEMARREIAALNARLDEAPTVGSENQETRDERAARVLAVAKSQAAEITARAQAAAEHTWAAAEQASVALRERYQRVLADLDRQHEEIHTAHRTIMETARVRAEDMTTAAERRRREIDAEAERDRVRIDREFSESIRTKRTALQAELDTARAAATEEAERLTRESRTDAERRIRAAGEEADRRLASSTAEVDRLTALRDQLAGQLRDTQELVEQVSATLTPADQELTFEDTLLLPPPAPIGDGPSGH